MNLTIVQNFGAGTQSIGLMLMALDGKFKNCPDSFVFADTGSEPKHVYNYLDMFEDYVKLKYNAKIDKVSIGNLESDIKDYLNGSRNRLANMPLFTGNGGLLRRDCTKDYKIDPIEKWIKNKYQIGRKKKDSKPIIEQWIGLSLEEIHRCKISQKWWTVFNYPLIFERLYRNEVVNYVTKYHNLPEPPRSSCYFCPFHSNNYWRYLKDKHHNEFIKAIEIDKMIRQLPGLDNETYLHRELILLSEVDLWTNAEKGQPELIDECDGYCGT